MGFKECKKRKFYSQAGAEKLLNYINEARKKDKSQKRNKQRAAYKCPICKFFHLTSQEQR